MYRRPNGQDKSQRGWPGYEAAGRLLEEVLDTVYNGRRASTMFAIVDSFCRVVALRRGLLIVKLLAEN